MRREALLLALLLTAGCVTQAPAAIVPASTAYVPSALTYKLDKLVELSVPVDGGVALHGTIYLPKGGNETKFPILMDMGPYYGDLNPETSSYDAKQPPNELYAHFLARGYAIALVSLRGTGLSGGCFMIGGAQERADVAAAIEWLASQDYSNGAIGMIGISYDGTTPWEGLVSGAAPHLKAIVPGEGITDHYRYSFFEGVPVGGGETFNTYYTALVDVAYANPTGIPDWLPQQATPSRLCADQANVILHPYQTYRDGLHDAFWQERDAEAMLSNATSPVFIVQGTKDFNVKMDNVQTLWPRLPNGSRMLIGQWEHNVPWDNSFDPKLNFTAYNRTLDQFLDAYLAGDAAALAAEKASPPVLAQDSTNLTWNLTAWPPANATWTTLQPAADGSLSAASAPEGSVSFQASPAAFALDENGVRAPAALATEAVFTTAAFDRDTILMGNPHLDLNVSVDRAEGDLGARLLVLHADGKEQPVSMGWQNLATRSSREKSEEVPVGTPIPVRVLMEGIAQHVEKGDKLILVLGPSDGDAAAPHVSATKFTVKLGGADGARLALPMLPASG